MEPHEYRVMAEVEDSHWWFLGLRELTFQGILRYCPDGARLLDAGCGTGGLLRYLRGRSRMFRACGVDLSPDAIRYLRSAAPLPVARASVERLPFRDGSFDAVASLDVLYIEGVDDRRALREFFRVLKPGGVLALNLPAFEFMRSAHDRAVHTRHRYRRPEVVGLLQEAGFSVLKATYWNALLFPLICLVRLARFRRAGEGVSSDVRKTPSLLNALLLRLLKAENRWVGRSSFPVGTSVFCVGRKTSPSPNLEERPLLPPPSPSGRGRG